MIAAQRIEQEMRAAIPRHLADWPPKALAKHVGTVPRTAKAWKDGENLPQAHHIVALEQLLPEFAEEMRRIRALPGENFIAADDLAERIAAKILAGRPEP